MLAAAAIYFLAEHPLWLWAVEGLFALSAVVGYLLVRAFFVPFAMIRTGSELIRERDFVSRFRETGVAELDELIRIYNEMIDRLREERLRGEERNRFLEKLLAAAPAGVVTLDHDGRVVQINPEAERLLGCGAGEVLGRKPEELRGARIAQLAELPAGGSRVLSAGGAHRLKATRAEFHDRGFPRSFFVIEELTAELRASERAAYEKLIRMMSHEINNSVGAVRSLLESCRNYGGQLRAGDREEFETAIEVAVSRLGHLDEFMRGFAEVVRLPAPRPQPIDPRRLIDDVLRLLKPELDRRGIACELRIEGAPALVAADRQQMEQVLVNIFKNAAESIGENGRIAVRFAHDRGRGRAVLSVRDTGAGISDEARARLFTPFFSTKRDGRGIGLTLVQEILAAHRFEFGLEGLPDGGAEFWIAF